MKIKKTNIEEYVKGISEGDIATLAQAITLVESKKPLHLSWATDLLEQVSKPTRQTLRIGMTGSPGVGKSSFIEGFGHFLIAQGKKVAVLAIDPSSPRTGGSILGDKTRMETLSKHPQSFVRPSASNSSNGGVHRKTREAILLCEAAGFDVIIVETVGVGQSEVGVHSMVDFFLLLMQPGSGDDLQGMKKGIMEMAEGIVVNKYDGAQSVLARKTQTDLLSALQMFTPHESGWRTQVQLCSALEKKGFEEVWQMLLDFEQKMRDGGWFEKKRSEQNVQWFEQCIQFEWMQHLCFQKSMRERINRLKICISGNRISVNKATEELFQYFSKVMMNKKVSG